MTHDKSDSTIIPRTHNVARFCLENRQIAWVLLIATLLWGLFGYLAMPQRKDPDLPPLMAAALTPWPGAGAQKVEQLVTKKVEEKMAENAKVKKIESISKTGLSVVYVELLDTVLEPGKEFDDIRLKLDSIRDLPEGAGPVQFIKDFGDTAALMLTVASPPADEMEIALRARAVREAIELVRREAKPNRAGSRFTLVHAFPQSISPRLIQLVLEDFSRYTSEKGIARDIRQIEGAGFVGLDGKTDADDGALLIHVQRFMEERLRPSEMHPDSWDPVVIRDPREAEARLASVAVAKYSYRELNDFTDLIKRTLQTIPQVSKVTRSGVLPEAIYLHYSQERLASYNLQVSTLDRVLQARNIATPGGALEIDGKTVTIDPAGEFKSQQEIGDVLISTTSTGTPLYLRDLVDISRGYEAPPKFLNQYSWRDDRGSWHRSRAVTLAVQMKAGEQISIFGSKIDAALADLRHSLPDDLILARTSDQTLQVEESVHLFMSSLLEAVVLVVLVSWVGFWEWRSALVMALSIPITLAMTFGMMHLLGIDLQQVSIASLIIALGLLVDDPVVAGDAIKRELAAGQPAGSPPGWARPSWPKRSCSPRSRTS